MNERFLVDTNVLSEFNQSQPPNFDVKSWLSSTPFSSIYVSVITLAEIRFGIELRSPGRRRLDLERWFEVDLHHWFDGGRILVVDEETGGIFARLTAERQFKGRPLSVLDGLIAATAVKHKLTMVTRDERDFADLGVPILNPWRKKSYPSS